MDIPFLKAKYFTEVWAPRSVGLVVIHAAEVAPRAGMARWLMNYCAENDRKASWHYAVDSDEITQSVHEKDVAWHAPGANSRGVGVELATMGLQRAEVWSDGYHQKMLGLAAFLTAGICARWKIEPFYVDANGLLEGRRGITTHAEVTFAYKESTHMDPGPGFPMEFFVGKVKARLDAGNFEV